MCKKKYMTTQNKYSRYQKKKKNPRITPTNSIEQKALTNPYESHALETL